MNLFLLLGIYFLSNSGNVNGQTTLVGPCFRRQSGFARDVNNCAQYFICQNGQAIRGRCPPKLMFDAENESCMWREDVTCFSCPQTEVYSLQRVANTCHQFYRCWMGIVTIHTCPNDLVFDPAIRRCNFPYGTGCEGDTAPPSDTCPAVDGPTPIYKSDPNSCSNYYVCSGGRQIQRQCAQGLHFNPILEVCDIPENANCQSGSQPPEEEDPDQPDPPEEGESQGQPCPSQGHGFVPHRDNCNAYFACSNRQATLVHCAPGLHFDFERSTCDRPQNARCWSHENPPPISDDNGGQGGGGYPMGNGIGGLPSPLIKPKSDTMENVLNSIEN